ncbi:MAG: Uma2 family endonuclease [Gloeobacterales cyanobacterium]
MVQTPIKSVTLEEFLQLPETKPASEYIDGEIIQKPMPNGRHSIIQRELLFAISPLLSEQGIAEAFPELRCTFGNRSIVPDVAVFTTSRIPRTEDGEIEDFFTAVPNWIIEILSPDQRRSKVLKNIRHCLDHGAQMGWLIDPDDQSVFVGQIGQQFTIIDEPDIPLPIPEFAAELKLTVGEILGWLKRKSNAPTPS